MAFILTKITASNLNGKITRKIKTEVISAITYFDALKLVKEKYIKPLGKLTMESVGNGYSVWETRTEYEPGKHVGIRYRLEEEEDEVQTNISSVELAKQYGLLNEEDE